MVPRCTSSSSSTVGLTTRDGTWHAPTTAGRARHSDGGSARTKIPRGARSRSAPLASVRLRSTWPVRVYSLSRAYPRAACLSPPPPLSRPPAPSARSLSLLRHIGDIGKLIRVPYERRRYNRTGEEGRLFRPPSIRLDPRDHRSSTE